MWILAALAGVAALMLLRSEYEKHHVTVKEYSVTPKKPLKEEKTLVFLSDLHGNCFGKKQEELLAAIEKVKPDGIFVGGDMMVTNRKKDRVDVSAALFLLENLARRYPVFYGYGNHESRMERSSDLYGDAFVKYRRRLEKAGVLFVSGKKQACFGEEIRVRGLVLEKKHYRRGRPETLEPSYIEERLGKADPKKVEILLAHSPMFFDAYATWGADVALAGHFHGGTIWIPGLGGLMTPQFQFFYPYCAGCFEKAGKYLVVSRGLGTHSVNIRLNNPSQVVVITLKPKQG